MELAREYGRPGLARSFLPDSSADGAQSLKQAAKCGTFRAIVTLTKIASMVCRARVSFVTKPATPRASTNLHEHQELRQWSPHAIDVEDTHLELRTCGALGNDDIACHGVDGSRSIAVLKER